MPVSSNNSTAFTLNYKNATKTDDGRIVIARGDANLSGDLDEPDARYILNVASYSSGLPTLTYTPRGHLDDRWRGTLQASGVGEKPACALSSACMSWLGGNENEIREGDGSIVGTLSRSDNTREILSGPGPSLFSGTSSEGASGGPSLLKPALDALEEATEIVRIRT